MQGQQPKLAASAAEVVSDFLGAWGRDSILLLLEGEPGIGKTTIWQALVDRATMTDGTVLTARPTEAESMLAFATLADLLYDVPADVVDELPAPQRMAVDHVLSRVVHDDLQTDPAATAAALLSVVHSLAARGPVLLAVDDLQWADSSSAQTLASVARRLPTAASIAATVRTGVGTGVVTWLQPPRPHALRRHAVAPLDGAALDALITACAGRRPSRRALTHVRRLSRGNPFYAAELARALPTNEQSELGLPESVTEMVRLRLGDVDADVRRVLLVAAALADPTVSLVRAAVGLAPDRFARCLDDAESRGLLEVSGPRVRFTHPLLASGVYAEAATSARHELHRRLAECVPDPSERAIHLARATVEGDAATLQALDEAAAASRVRGAPAAAAELLEMAIELDDGAPERHFLLAQHLVDSGEADRATTVLLALRGRLAPGPFRARVSSAVAGVHLDADSFVEAARHLEAALAESEPGSDLRVEVLTRLAYALLNCGRSAEARVRAAEAVAAGDAEQSPHLLAQASGIAVMVGFVLGDGVDEHLLAQALTLEDTAAIDPVAFRPGVHAGLLRAWTGRLEGGVALLEPIRHRCLDLGREHDMMFLDLQLALVSAWRGDLADVRRRGADLEQRADQLEGQQPAEIAHTVNALAAAYAGDVATARQLARRGVEEFWHCGLQVMTGLPLSILGFVDLSVGDHAAALDTLQPLVESLLATPRATEILMSSFVPDAVEALAALGRSDEAEPLVHALEDNGRRLDRPWLIGTGARCRSLLLGAAGDPVAALAAAQAAVLALEPTSMPFDLARTQLLVGHLHRRLRHPAEATAALKDALSTFETLGVRLWADRCHAELARVGVGHGSSSMLTAAEERVVGLAASGMTNREAAAALFISPKTVEAHLAKVYRKLGIRSRAELGRHVGAGGVRSD